MTGRRRTTHLRPTSKVTATPSASRTSQRTVLRGYDHKPDLRRDGEAVRERGRWDDDWLEANGKQDGKLCFGLVARTFPTFGFTVAHSPRAILLPHRCFQVARTKGFMESTRTVAMLWWSERPIAPLTLQLTCFVDTPEWLWAKGLTVGACGRRVEAYIDEESILPN